MTTPHDYGSALAGSGYEHVAAYAAAARTRARYHNQILGIANDLRQYASIPEGEQARIDAARAIRELEAEVDEHDYEVADYLREKGHPHADRYSTEGAHIRDGEASWTAPDDDERSPAAKSLDETATAIHDMWIETRDQLHHEHTRLPDIPAEARDNDNAEAIREQLRPVARACLAFHQLAEALHRL